MNLNNLTQIHFVGIGGIGTSALARLFLKMGKRVTGSDLRKSITTDELTAEGVEVLIGHSEKNIFPRTSLLIYSEDISPESKGFVEVAEAKRKKIPTLTYSSALGFLMEGKYGVGVTGTNGKSTTTALLGLMLEKAGLDPTVVLGSKLLPKNFSDKFRFNARLGEGKFFVAESDEYHRHMMDNSPEMIILTNVAEDHLDYYRDLSEIKQAFAEYVAKLPEDGILIFNADDHNAVEVGRSARCHKFTFGIHHYADLQAINLNTVSGKQTFDLHLNDELFGQAELKLPGLFNVANALGAGLAAIKLGASSEAIEAALRDFAGIWRRFEKVGEVNGKIVISDYAHHPAAVNGTIEAAKQFFPGKKILYVFQPHHRNRTKKLFGEFVEALNNCEELILPEIFDVAGREHGEKISSSDLAYEINKLNGSKAVFVSDLAAAKKLIMEKLPAFDVVLCMGAGDIDLMARELAKNE